MGCEACQRCLPKYFCVDVVVEPGPYSDVECCDPDDYTGNGYFPLRLASNCGGWSGTGGCPGGPGLTMSMALSADCTQTIVSSTASDEVFPFDGILPAGMRGVIENEQGDLFHWEINTAAVVENPLAKDCDSPCSCLKCLPEKLCVLLLSDPNGETMPRVRTMVSLLWDCLTRSWLPIKALPPNVAISVALAPAYMKVCGLIVSCTVNGASFDGVVILEGGLHPRKFHGTQCTADDGIQFTEGIPELKPCPPEDPECPDPPPQEFASAMNFTRSLVIPTDQPHGGMALGSVTIKDQSCGDCSLPCEPNKCCSEVTVPHSLHATSGAPGCFNCASGSTDWPLSYNAGLDAWTASQEVCGRQWSIMIYCKLNDFGEPLGWYIRRFCAGSEANSETAATTAVCEPFHLEFIAVLFRIDECNCKDQFGNLDGWQSNFTVTA